MGFLTCSIASTSLIEISLEASVLLEFIFYLTMLSTVKKKNLLKQKGVFLLKSKFSLMIKSLFFVIYNKHQKEKKWIINNNYKKKYKSSH